MTIIIVVKMEDNMTNQSPYCDLVDTGAVFNNKNVYSCSYCGIKIGLDNLNTKMLCFKKIQDYSLSIRNIIRPQQNTSIIDVKPGEAIQDIVLNNVLELDKQQKAIESGEDDPSNMCSEEQIDNRLSICKSCEYYQNNSCILCGCQIVREANYMNKLAHKNQACPDGKWGPIIS